MSKLIYFFICSCLILSSELHAQKKQGIAAAQDWLKFTGIWIWQSDSTMFTLVLKKIILKHTWQYLDSTAAAPVIVGCYQYYEKGKLIASTLHDLDSAEKGKASLFGNLTDVGKLTGTFVDSVYGDRLYYQLEYLGGSPPRLIWTTTYQHLVVWLFNGGKIQKWQTIPTGIVLKKID